MGATSVLTVANLVLTAASQALSGSSAGPINRVLMSPGAEVAWDECECGLLALSTGRVYRSRGQIFNDAGDVFLNCDAEIRVVSFSLSVVRCVPSVGDNVTSAPTADALTAAFAIQEEDGFLVWEAVTDTLCALVKASPPQVPAYVVNERVPLGPQGGCAGSQINFKVGWYRPCNCE